MEDKKGDISQWNEGMFKSERINRAQNQINFFRNRPFIRSENKWGYEWWIDGLDQLFGEGIDKYSDSEKTKSKASKKEIEEFIKKTKICSLAQTHQGKIVNIDTSSWEKLKDLLEEWEDYVKTCNNKHGYSTKVLGTGGMFG